MIKSHHHLHLQDAVYTCGFLSKLELDGSIYVCDDKASFEHIFNRIVPHVRIHMRLFVQANWDFPRWLLPLSMASSNLLYEFISSSSSSRHRQQHRHAQLQSILMNLSSKHSSLLLRLCWSIRTSEIYLLKLSASTIGVPLRSRRRRNGKMATGSSVRALVSLLTGNIEKQRNARSCPFKLTFPLVHICSAVWNSVLTQHEIVTSCQEIIVFFLFQKTKKEEFSDDDDADDDNNESEDGEKRKPKLNIDWERRKSREGEKKRRKNIRIQARERGNDCYTRWQNENVMRMSIQTYQISSMNDRCRCPLWWPLATVVVACYFRHYENVAADLRNRCRWIQGRSPVDRWLVRDALEKRDLHSKKRRRPLRECQSMKQTSGRGWGSLWRRWSITQSLM